MTATEPGGEQEHDIVMPTSPGHDCAFCPRLAAFRDVNRKAHPDWFNAPVPTFGSASARLLIVGLAPGLQGANRTGRPFTGDFAGDLLYDRLVALGLAEGSYERRPDDGLALVDCAITNAVRCVPPQNKPMPIEIRTCQQFMDSLLAAMGSLQTILALGRIAHDSVLRAFDMRISAAPFGHGSRHVLQRNGGDQPISLFDSYHCSRYNTNTGVLTKAMFSDVLQQARDASRINAS